MCEEETDVSIAAAPIEDAVLDRYAVKRFHVVAERIVADQRAHWPGTLRIKRAVSAPRIGEMAWPFSDPDGRATFEWIEIEGNG